MMNLEEIKERISWIVAVWGLGVFVTVIVGIIVAGIYYGYTCLLRAIEIYGSDTVLISIIAVIFVPFIGGISVVIYWRITERLKKKSVDE